MSIEEIEPKLEQSDEGGGALRNERPVGETAGTGAEIRRKALVFGLAFALAAGGVLLLGAFAESRRIIEGVLISLLTFAFLPVVLILAGIALPIMLIALEVMVCLFAAVAAALGGDGGVAGGFGLTEGGVSLGEGLIRFGAKIFRPYYRFLARQKHPAFWAVPLGCLAGTLGLWLGMGVKTIPKKTDTVYALLLAQDAVERHYKERGSYPEPTTDGRIWVDPFNPKPAGATRTDGYGRPLVYEVKGVWKAATYRIRSLGADGKPGKDDLCVTGSTKLARAAGKAAEFWREAREKKKPGEKTPMKTKLKGIEALRCEEGAGL